jgi:hypothetical protein
MMLMINTPSRAHRGGVLIPVTGSSDAFLRPAV